MSDKVYRRTVLSMIASSVTAIDNCERNGNKEWLNRHKARLSYLVRNFLPSGSGFDNGTTLCKYRSFGAEELKFQTSFHHMNDHGMYVKWTEHTITVRPLFNGFSISVSGINYRDIKEYIIDTFDVALNTKVELQHECDMYVQSVDQS